VPQHTSKLARCTFPCSPVVIHLYQHNCHEVCRILFPHIGEDTGAPYLTLKRLPVWVSEPMQRLKTLASLTDALETLPTGKLIAALDAAAQHGDPSVSATVSATHTILLHDQTVYLKFAPLSCQKSFATESHKAT